MNRYENIDERLARLRRETEAITPPAGLAARLAARVVDEAERSWLHAIARYGRRSVTVAAFTACAAMVIAGVSGGLDDVAEVSAELAP